MAPIQHTRLHIPMPFNSFIRLQILAYIVTIYFSIILTLPEERPPAGGDSNALMSSSEMQHTYSHDCHIKSAHHWSFRFLSFFSAFFYADV